MPQLPSLAFFLSAAEVSVTWIPSFRTAGIECVKRRSHTGGPASRQLYLTTCHQWDRCHQMSYTDMPPERPLIVHLTRAGTLSLYQFLKVS